MTISIERDEREGETRGGDERGRREGETRGGDERGRREGETRGAYSKSATLIIEWFEGIN